jgi:hypothetical protein
VAFFALLREERKTGRLSGKGMNESFKDEDKNIVKDEDLTPDFMNESFKDEDKNIVKDEDLTPGFYADLHTHRTGENGRIPRSLAKKYSSLRSGVPLGFLKTAQHHARPQKAFWC